MTLTAKTLGGIEVFAPKLSEKRQGFICRFCGQPMIFVDAQLKIKHFRHKTESSCDYEPETEEHENYKWLVYNMLINKRIGEVFVEHRIGNVIADIYMDREGWPNIVFEIQATNYSPLKYEEKIRSYAFRRLLVVYIFVGNDFNKEIKTNIYSLKEIEKRIFNEKMYRDTVIGCYLNDESIIIPSFKQKHAKGHSGHCTNRFIIDYTKIRHMSLNAFLDYVLEYRVNEHFQPECKHNNIRYQKSDGIILRYKVICADCEKFIKWLPNKEAEAMGLRL